MKNKKLLVMLLLVFLVGCSSDKDLQNKKDTVKNKPTLTIYDDSGEKEELEIKKDPERVVVLGEALVDYMDYFGLKDKIVGVGYLDSGDSVKKDSLKGLNVLTTMWPSKEVVLSLKPDLVYSMSSGFKDDRSGSLEFYKSNDIMALPAINFTTGRSLQQYYDDLDNFKKIFKIENEVDEFLNKEKEKINSSLESVKKHDEKVLFISRSSNKDFYCPKEGVLISEIIEDFGYEYQEISKDSYIELSDEIIIKNNPDKIIVSEFQSKDPDSLVKSLLDNKNLKDIKAIKNKEVFSIDYTSAVRGEIELSNTYKTLSTFLNGGASVEKN
ncbi:MAG: ABC transporter substrate-binding protein [Peptostreptococcus sp.]|uniref:ABC transporter substrate-binding protein n=1 Tax=Peptostreptococcus sp. TaxID=1262 RepID=UPI002FCC4EFE